LAFSFEKSPTMSRFFEKNKSGKFTPNSLLRYNILQYYTDVLKPNRESTFLFSELIKWIIKRNDEISNYYKGPSTRNIPIRNRISNNWERIKKRFEELKYLRLIIESDTKKSLKGKSVQLYEYTTSGRLASLILYLISLEEGEQKNRTVLEIYLVMRSFFSNQSALSKFGLSILEQLWKKKFFPFYLEVMAISFGSDKRIFDDSILGWSYLDITEMKKTAFSQLTEKEKKVLLYFIKTTVENIFYTNSEYNKDFEETAFSCRGKEKRIAVEGFCTNCKLTFSNIIKTLDYFSAPAITGAKISGPCPKCNMPNSMQIPIYRSPGNLLLADFQ
jgi:hypothetical protein